MKMSKLTGIALATAAAGFFAMAPAISHAAEGDVKCAGVNGCKGKGACKSATNECKGKNACKGKGFDMMSKADCDKATAAMKKK